MPDSPCPRPASGPDPDTPLGLFPRFNLGPAPGSIPRSASGLTVVDAGVVEADDGSVVLRRTRRRRDAVPHVQLVALTLQMQVSQICSQVSNVFPRCGWFLLPVQTLALVFAHEGALACHRLFSVFSNCSLQIMSTQTALLSTFCTLSVRCTHLQCVVHDLVPRVPERRAAEGAPVRVPHLGTEHARREVCEAGGTDARPRVVVVEEGGAGAPAL